MKKIKVLSPDNITDHFPHLKQWTARVVKIVLHHLDGTKNEMKLTWPIVTYCGDDEGFAECYLQEFVQRLTRHFLKISSYEIHHGSINTKGEECYDGTFMSKTIEIPLNKVFVPSHKFGTWQNPETVKKKQMAKREKKLTDHLNNGKHILNGEPIKSNPEFAALVYAN